MTHALKVVQEEEEGSDAHPSSLTLIPHPGELPREHALTNYMERSCDTHQATFQGCWDGEKSLTTLYALSLVRLNLESEQQLPQMESSWKA